MFEIERQSLGKGHLGTRKIGNGHSLFGFPGGSVGKESTCNAGDLNLTPGWGRSPGEGSGNPLQYCCLGNPMDREAWQAAVPWGCKRARHVLATKQQAKRGKGTTQHHPVGK